MSLTSAFLPETSCLSPVDEVIRKDVSYGNDSLQKLDIYLPAGRASSVTKSLILIHGGSWNSGSKSDFTGHIDSLRKRLPDYAIFNIDYRLLTQGFRFPAQEEDVNAAVQFIVDHSQEYGINPSRLVLLGASAGAHLALLNAYKSKSHHIAAVIDFFGPTDLTAMYDKPWHPYLPSAMKMITGTTPRENPDAYRTWSPISFVDSGSAPTLILHGSKDPLVDISQSAALDRALTKAGVIHQFITYPGERHGWRGATLSKSFDAVQKFLTDHVL